ncbi:DUF6333 family protein [Streptomyces sp. ODS28]|uniref:DUF6333 family protein n=1 Tax=Streptomyces sp. ODS28 TaxID=3136688 RepID=UPI0031E52914
MSLDLALACTHSVTRITRVHPPPPAHVTPRTVGGVPAHDSARAREVIGELSTVSAVLEELPQVARGDLGSPSEPGDLDCVAVGCWGGVVQIHDPAFGEDGTASFNLDPVFDAQVKAHPEARITAACEMDFSLTYAKYLAHVPGAPPVSVEGWDEMTVAGDPAEALRACGDDPARPRVDFDFDFADPDRLDWSAYLDLIACGLHLPLADEPLEVSVFRVSRPEDIRENLEEVWLPE